MAEIIRMPKMSDTMEEGVIANWNVKVGDKVKSGDILAEVETDKATMDMESYQEGTILYIGVEKGQAVAVDGILAIIGEAGEDFSGLLAGGGASAPATPSEQPIETTTPNLEQADVLAQQAAEKIDTSGIKAEVIRMPLLSDTMTEGVIIAWLKNIGDPVKSGDILAEIETDKATMELEAYDEGTLLYQGVKAGEAAAVNSIIAVIGESGANYELLLKAHSAPAGLDTPAHVVEVPTPAAGTAPVAAEVAAGSQTDSRIKASPLAKRMAQEKGINLSDVKGSGENGRIIKSDIDNFVPAAKAAQPSASQSAAAPTAIAPAVYGQESYEDFPLSQMRKTIARRLSESKFSAPEFYLTMEINMDNAMAARGVMNEASPVKISFNDMVLKAAAVALSKHPNVNSSWMGDKIRRNHHIHIGMAVAVEDGLLVPVVRFANTKSLSQIAAETKDLGGKAKSKQLQPKDWEGNTFTVSNLGMFGIDEFTSIINPPESCILAVGGIKETVAVKDGNFYATNVMKLTLTCDHRVVDGATGAAFLVTLKELLEQPYKLLV